MSGHEQARRELRSPAFAPLWARAREALEKRGGQLDGSFALPALSTVERRAVHGLLGRVPVRLALRDLDDAMRAATGESLVAFVEALDGPLRDRPAERADRLARRSTAESMALDSALAGEPWFGHWLEGARSDGLIATSARLEERRYLDDALAVLAEVLPGRVDEVSLATVAAAATGDTKRLASATVRALVESALALASGVARPATSQERRLLWRRFGVVVDDVSSDVLVLNVRARGVGRLARWLGEAADAGEPFRVTLRQLGSSDVVVDAPVVWVCENPAVVIDVATRLGASAGTLVCTEGVPTDAFWDLTTRRSSASELRVRADFDATGLAIVGSIVARAGGRPWRFDAATYRAALDAHGRDAPLPRSKGTPPPTPWDPPLQAAVAADGRAVYEELLLDATLADLASAG